MARAWRRRLTVGVFAVFGASALAGAAQAGEQFVDENGVANFGYDVVAYHTALAATPGSADFTADHNDAVFYFASAENRDLFLADPARYAPAYDGHCAFALVSHKKLTIDPEAFSIVDPETLTLVDPETYSPDEAGVLYLNYSSGVNDEFNDDLAGNIAKADFAWTDCLENQPAARPNKSFRDFFGGKRPKECPAAE
ncbi:MAG: YHS domain-containing (seleno)protein [Pseudomonadota bacterium]